jgi:hypothetical protein
VTTIFVPQNSTAVSQVDPVVEVSLVPDSPVATLALPLLAATRAAALAHLPGRAGEAGGSGGRRRRRLAPQSPEERARLEAAGIPDGEVLTLAGHPRLLVDSLSSPGAPSRL